MAAIDRLYVRLGDAVSTKDNELLEELLSSAAAAILSRRFPFGHDAGQEVPAQYEDLQIRIAVDMFNKIGAEGETMHSENGISRTYDSGWVSESLLSEVVPMVGVIR